MKSTTAFTLVVALFVLIFSASSSAGWLGRSAWNADRGWNPGGGEQEDALHLKPNIDNGRKVWEICSACHLQEGWGTTDGEYPQLAGQHSTVLIKQLADIRALNRDNPTMYPFAVPDRIGGTQAIADVVAYIERILMNPEHGKGPRKDAESLAKGKALYHENCAGCHGENGEGDAEEYYPRIAGQHYKYMLRQFEWIRVGKRRNANPEMHEQIKRFTLDEEINVINYVSYLKVDPKLLAPSIFWHNTN